MQQQKATRDIKRFINVNSGCGETLLTKLCNEDGTSVRAYDFEITVHSTLYHAVGLMAYGLPRAVMQTTGKESCIGLKFSDVPGARLLAKVTWVYQQTVTDILAFAKRNGFYAPLNADTPQMLLIPAGYIVVVFTEEEDSVSLQFPFIGGKNDYACIHEMQKELVLAYPECNTLTMQALHSLVSTEVA